MERTSTDTKTESRRTDASLDVRLIPEYDGSSSQPISEWLEKVELVCRIRGIDDVTCVIPLRLAGGAYAVYSQLPLDQQRDAGKVKDALRAAFEVDRFVAYERFISRKLRTNEQPDAFLADLRRLAGLFGGLTDEGLACAFVAGLPGNVRQPLRAGSRMENLSLQDIVGRARAVLNDDFVMDRSDACLGAAEPRRRQQQVRQAQKCFSCGGMGHFARECPTPRQSQDADEPLRANVRRKGRASLLPRPTMTKALPSIRLRIDGVSRNVLVDTGCTTCVAHVSGCKRWTRRPVALLAVNGKELECQGMGEVGLERPDGGRATVEAIVVDAKPLGFDFILGMNGIEALGGVFVSKGPRVSFGPESAPVCSAGVVPVRLEERDFTVAFDPVKRVWTAAWKWTGSEGPALLKNSVKEYPPNPRIRASYEAEVEKWVDKGWLVPYDARRHGQAKGLIPLMAVVQRHKQKVRPVMDFRELNTHIESFTAAADVCADRLRQWRRQGANVAVIDLNDAYLQVHVDEALWPYQTVEFRGHRYCLTRLGFGLNVAPLIMKTVLSSVLSQNPAIKQGTSAYIDDILVNESVVPTRHVEEELERYGLQCKPPERLVDGARVLGLKVSKERGQLMWARGNPVGDVPQELTRRAVFAYCGELVGHLPVCGWLRVAAAFAKRSANAATRSWDDPTDDATIRPLLEEISARVKNDDPARGVWNVSGDMARLWVDASGLALGVALEVGGAILEDASWLRRDEAQHINMAELDAVIRGLNLALSWKMRTVELMTDSATVHRWVSDGLSGKARLRTKAAGEMLIRRRISTVVSLVEEYALQLSVTLVKSEDNRADALTRVPQRWLKAATGPSDSVCAAASDSEAMRLIAAVHHAAGHPGVRRTSYFVRRSNPAIDRGLVRQVVTECQVCQSIDPPSAKWEHGTLEVPRIWQRVAIDITHCGARPVLTLIDCGPSRFAVWRPLRLQTSADVIEQLENIFCERGAPEELLLDNDTAFRSRPFTAFAAHWGVRLRFRCAYVPSGNGIAERCHRSVKVIAARKGCSIPEAVYLYNVTPRVDCSESSTPAAAMYPYDVRVREVDQLPTQDQPGAAPYVVGEKVWIKPPGARCVSTYHQGTVTAVLSRHAVEVDGTPRHVRDLRHRMAPEETHEQVPPGDDPNDELVLHFTRPEAHSNLL
ncbi:hypothetical protein M513_09540 [Trichuris suis]|uniref:Uncharacterized protein n=1 Tax=Trichuris suis TaxID=68888 RepID=A0A085LXA1_9BILA|nr:hypothetical protein M513_09540 [Trichuris suis]